MVSVVGQCYCHATYISHLPALEFVKFVDISRNIKMAKSFKVFRDIMVRKHVQITTTQHCQQSFAKKGSIRQQIQLLEE